jgi:hypothetical protein
LKLDDYIGAQVELKWVDVSNGTAGDTARFVGGSISIVDAPTDGPWVATIVCRPPRP